VESRYRDTEYDLSTNGRYGWPSYSARHLTTWSPSCVIWSRWLRRMVMLDEVATRRSHGHRGAGAGTSRWQAPRRAAAEPGGCATGRACCAPFRRAGSPAPSTSASRYGRLHLARDPRACAIAERPSGHGCTTVAYAVALARQWCHPVLIVRCEQRFGPAFRRGLYRGAERPVCVDVADASFDEYSCGPGGPR